MEVVKKIQPQPGFQWSVLSNPADVIIMGGSAGCGKTYTLLLEPIRHLDVQGYDALIFRREHVQIFSPGGLWDKATELYLGLPYPYSPQVRQNHPSFRFPTGSSVNFAHLNQVRDVLKYQGAQIAYIAFDELTHFEEYQFFYMLSRNRTTCGVKPIIRASTNPQGEGWVKELIQWWIFPDDHPDETVRCLPIRERAGLLRYFVRYDNKIYWGDTQQEAWDQLPEAEQAKIPVSAVKSLTFIGGKLADNPELTRKDPGYVGGLLAQSEEDRVQLLDGRWINPDADARRLYDDDEINDFMTNEFIEPGPERYLTCDVALEGADSFTAGIWEGWVLTHAYEFEQTEAAEVNPLITRIAKKHRIPRSHISFDATGVGAMLKGYLQWARPITGASAPWPEKEEIGHGKKQIKSQYLNLRVQLMYKFKEKLAGRQAFCGVEDVDLRRKIEQQLKAIKKAETKPDGKLRIISNDDIRKILKGKSPDLAVMVIQRAAFELKPVKRAVKKRPVRAI